MKVTDFESLGPRARAPSWALKTAVGGARARADPKPNGDLTGSYNFRTFREKSHCRWTVIERPSLYAARVSWVLMKMPQTSFERVNQTTPGAFSFHWCDSRCRI